MRVAQNPKTLGRDFHVRQYSSHLAGKMKHCVDIQKHADRSGELIRGSLLVMIHPCEYLEILTYFSI